jgi:hypothetical protein
MASIASTQRINATEYRITRVHVANQQTGETFAVPNLLLAVADMQGIVDHLSWNGVRETADLICEACGESVADCPELRGQLVNVPESWSWEYRAAHAHE